MLEAVNLHTRYGEVPAADKAAAVAWSLLKRSHWTAVASRPSRSLWAIAGCPGALDRCYRCDIRPPVRPAGGDDVYIPAGKHSRGGFDVHLDVEAGDVWRGTVLASDLAR